MSREAASRCQLNDAIAPHHDPGGRYARFGFRGHRQWPAGVGGSKRAVRRAGLFRAMRLQF
jgi:hypothetical protein